MWRILFLILILFSSIAFAQVQEKSQAILQDVISGNFNSCPPYLDHLFISISENPNSRGVIITYQSVNSLPADFDHPKMFRAVKNQIKFRGFDESRIRVIFGGFRPKIETEFWFVPQGADEPQPTETLPKPTIPTDKTFLYTEKYMVDYDWSSETPFEFLSLRAQKKRIKYENESAEEDKKNGTEPSLTKEDTGFTKEELEEMKFNWVNYKFGEVLKSQKDSIGTIIFYGDEKEYNLKAVRAHVEQGKKRIVKESKLQPNQIKIVYGGYRESLEAEFWVTPKGAKLPTPKPEKREVEDANQ